MAWRSFMPQDLVTSPRSQPGGCAHAQAGGCHFCCLVPAWSSGSTWFPCIMHLWGRGRESHLAESTGQAGTAGQLAPGCDQAVNTQESHVSAAGRSLLPSVHALTSGSASSQLLAVCSSSPAATEAAGAGLVEAWHVPELAAGSTSWSTEEQTQAAGSHEVSSKGGHRAGIPTSPRALFHRAPSPSVSPSARPRLLGQLGSVSPLSLRSAPSRGAGTGPCGSEVCGQHAQVAGGAVSVPSWVPALTGGCPPGVTPAAGTKKPQEPARLP